VSRPKRNSFEKHSSCSVPILDSYSYSVFCFTRSNKLRFSLCINNSVHNKARFNLETTPETDQFLTMSMSYSTLNTKHAVGLNLNDTSQRRVMQRTLSSSSHQHQHIVSTRSTSMVSLASLDLHMQQPEEQMAMAGHISAVRELLSGRNIRLGPIIHLIIFSCLLFVTLSDAVFRMNAGNSNPELKSSSRLHNNGVNKQKSNLGSAMISSITDALSPILPFAGGVDLRRDEKWKSWRSYLSIFGEQEQDQNGTVHITGQNILHMRGGGIMKGGGLSANKSTSSGTRTVVTLSVSEPFLPTGEIAEMTLREISYTFRFVIEAGREGFVMESFLSKDFEGEPITARMEKAVRAIESAVEKSRGPDVLPATTALHHDLESTIGGPMSSAGYGDIDALKFCAAMRILAEWRVLRQVPPGYKGYAVGMSLGQKDVVSNVAKIEIAVHEWIEARSGQESQCDQDEVCTQRRSPTLRQLLLYEIDNDVHPNNKLPRLKEKTSAMGLLWVRRQLHYQTSIFDNIISVPITFPTVIDAVGAAYTEVYGKLHGWAVQKIFNYSFQAAPNALEIFRHMNPRHLAQVEAGAKSGELSSDEVSPTEEEFIAEESLTEAQVPHISSTEANDITNPRIEMADEFPGIECNQKNGGNPFLEFLDNVGKDIENIGRHVGNEWDKVVCNVSTIFKNGNSEEDGCQAKHNHNSLSTRGGGSTQSKPELSDDEIDEYVTKEMEKDAKDHIVTYLKVARPMLSDLAGLFEEMNMDDPTKV